MTTCCPNSSCLSEDFAPGGSGIALAQSLAPQMLRTLWGQQTLPATNLHLLSANCNNNYSTRFDSATSGAPYQQMRGKSVCDVDLGQWAIDRRTLQMSQDFPFRIMFSIVFHCFPLFSIVFHCFPIVIRSPSLEHVV